MWTVCSRTSLLFYLILVVVYATEQQERKQQSTTKDRHDEAVSSSKILPPKVPIELNIHTFDTYIQDDPKLSKSLWFLFFYTPYCQHCQHMSHVLVNVSKTIRHQQSNDNITMYIGKLDCTKNKPICIKYEIMNDGRYPTIKYSLDGILYDYYNGYDESSIIKFANRMNLPPIQIVYDVKEAEQLIIQQQQQINTDDYDYNGVGFLGTNPKALEDQINYYQMFKYIARHNQAYSQFFWLQSESQELSVESSSSFSNQELPFIQRLEPGVVEPKVWHMSNNTNDNNIIENLQRWVQENSIPSLSKLRFNNFARIRKNGGRPLVMSVVDFNDHDLIRKVHNHILGYIRSNPQQSVDKYHYGLLDSEWTTYLNQFDIIPDKKDNELQFWILDSINNQYWYNDTYHNLSKFLNDVESDVVKAKRKRSDTYGERGYHWIAEIFMDYYPFSLATLLILLCSLVVLLTDPPGSRLDNNKKKIASNNKTKNNNTKETKKDK